MEGPYCSCRLTGSGAARWGPADAANGISTYSCGPKQLAADWSQGKAHQVTAYSCSPYGESLLQLYGESLLQLLYGESLLQL